MRKLEEERRRKKIKKLRRKNEKKWERERVQCAKVRKVWEKVRK